MSGMKTTSSKFWKDVFMAIGHSVTIIDPDGIIIDANPATLKLTGLDSKDIIGKKCYEIFHNSDKEPSGCPRLKIIRSGSLEESNMEIEAAGGLYLVSCTPVFEDNKLSKIIHIATNITDRTKAEEALKESEENYRTIVEGQTEFISRMLPDGTNTFANDALCHFLGVKKEDIIGKKIPDMKYGPAIPEEDMKRIGEYFPSFDTDNRIKTIQCRFIFPNGDIRWVEWEDKAIFDESGKIVEFQSVGRDITKRKIAEEKLIEIQKLSTELALTNDINLIAKKTIEVMKNVLKFNTAFFILREGDSLRAIASIGMPEYDRIEFDINSKKGILPWVAREGKTYLTNNTKKDKLFTNTFGQQIPGSELCVPIKIENEVLGVLNTESKNLDEYTKEDVLMLEALASEVAVAVAYSKSLHKIQEELNRRKEIETILRKSEEKYKELVENANSIIAKFDKESKIISMNEYGLKFFGYEEEELIGKTWVETILPSVDSNGQDLQNFASKVFADPIEYGISINENITKNGGRVWVHWTNKPIIDENGDITAILSVGTDITDRKLAEDHLKSTKKELEDIIEFLPDATFIIDKDKKAIAWNRAMEKMTGILKKDIIGKDYSYCAVPFYGKQRPFLIDLIFDPESEISSKYDIVKRKGSALYAEVFTPTLYNNKGAYIWAIASPLLDEESNVIGAIESIRDVTEQKNVEISLKESEEKFRVFFEKANDSIMLFNLKDEVVDANEAALSLFGYSKEELLSLKVTDLQAPEFRGVPGNTIKTEFEIYTDRVFEAVDIDKWGNKFPVEVSTSKIYLKGECLALGITRDIRERKKFEQMIKESESTLRGIFTAAPIGINLIQNRKFVWSNDMMSEITGYSMNEIIGKNTRFLYLSDESYGKAGYDYNSKFAKGKIIAEVDTKWKRKDGKIIDIHKKMCLLDPNDSSKGYITSVMDVTKQKNSEEKLMTSEEKYRTLFEDSKDPIWTTNREGIIIDANQAAAELLGYSKNELIGLDVYGLYVDPGRRGVFQAEVEDKGFVKNFQTQLKTKDGRQLDLLFDFTIWKDNDGKIMGYRGIAHDITQNLKSQKQLEENLEYFAHLVDHIRNPLAIMSGFIQVEVENEKTKDRLMRQIDRIEDLIKQLDQGWMDTAETRKFLKRYI